LRWVYIERVRLYIHQNWARAEMLDDVKRGAKGHRRRDHRVARTDAQRRQANKHRVRGGTDRERGRRADERREFLLELFHFGSSGDPVRAECIGNFGDFFVAEERRLERKKSITHMV